MATKAERRVKHGELAERIRDLITEYAEWVGPYRCAEHGEDYDLCGRDCDLVADTLAYPAVTLTLVEYMVGRDDQYVVEHIYPIGQSQSASVGIATMAFP